MSNTYGTSEFTKILYELASMHDKKSKDYGTNTDPYANVCASAGFGVEPWIGALIREHDKTTRIQSFIANGRLENESLEDSLIDKAVYSVIALLLYRRTKTSKSETRQDLRPANYGHTFAGSIDACATCGYTGSQWEMDTASGKSIPFCTNPAGHVWPALDTVKGQRKPPPCAQCHLEWEDFYNSNFTIFCVGVVGVPK